MPMSFGSLSICVSRENWWQWVVRMLLKLLKFYLVPAVCDQADSSEIWMVSKFCWSLRGLKNQTSSQRVEGNINVKVPLHVGWTGKLTGFTTKLQLSSQCGCLGICAAVLLTHATRLFAKLFSNSRMDPQASVSIHWHVEVSLLLNIFAFHIWKRLIPLLLSSSSNVLYRQISTFSTVVSPPSPNPCPEKNTIESLFNSSIWGIEQRRYLSGRISWRE